MDLAALGMTNKEIANRLGITHLTVATHMQRLYRRLGISSNRVALMQYVGKQDAPETDHEETEATLP